MSSQITITPDELLVVNPEKRPLYRSVLGLVFSLIVMWQWARLAKSFRGNLRNLMDSEVGFTHLLFHVAVLLLPGLSALVFLWVALQGLRPLFGSRQVLRCTHGELELTSIDFGRAWRSRTFAKDEVRSAAFGAVSVSKYGATNGLVFRFQNNQVKALPGLKAREAQQILKAMQGLGFDVSIDPVMKMVIEMEDSRSSFLG